MNGLVTQPQKLSSPRWALDMHVRGPPLMGLSERVRVVMLSVLGGDVQALLILTVSSTGGKVKKNFTSFYSIFHPLTPFVTGRQGRFRPCPHHRVSVSFKCGKGE